MYCQNNVQKCSGDAVRDKLNSFLSCSDAVKMIPESIKEAEADRANQLRNPPAVLDIRAYESQNKNKGQQ